MDGTESVDEARNKLHDWIEGPDDKFVGVVRGLSDDLQAFANDVEIRANSMPWREAIWLKMSPEDQALVMEGYEDWFEGHDEAALAILDAEGRAGAWLDSAATLNEIDDAYWEVESTA